MVKEKKKRKKKKQKQKARRTRSLLQLLPVLKKTNLILLRHRQRSGRSGVTATIKNNRLSRKSCGNTSRVNAVLLLGSTWKEWLSMP